MGILELRVHGVNNTTAPALLDLPPEDVERVAGDRLGSFWRPRPEAVADIPPGARGHVPPGIVREAYSWGGMVRGTGDLHRSGAFGVAAAAATRVFYALLLPFSIANVAGWTRRVAPEGELRRSPAAGAARVFALLLTLLFTTTAASVALDLGAAQCGADPSMCAPLTGLFAPLAELTAGRRLALFALLPVLAVGVLWIVSAVASVRYDVLPPMSARYPTARSTPAPAPTAALAAPGFWSNHATRHLAGLHLSAAVLLTAGFAAAHAAFAWYTDCAGLAGYGACLGEAPTHPLFTPFVVLAATSGLALLAVVTLAAVLPTTRTVSPDAEAPGRRSTRIALIVAFALFLAVEGMLVTAPDPGVGVTRLYGAGATPLILVGAALLIALSGMFWRGGVARRHTAWHGCAPAVFMLVALTLAAATSATVVVAVGDLLNGAASAADLARDPASVRSSPAISSSYIALGTTVLAGLAAGLLVLLLLIARRDVSPRVRRWGGPTSPDDPFVPDGVGVLPPSRSALLRRIVSARATAARVHTIEPVMGVLAVTLAAGLTAGVLWSGAAYLQRHALWNVLPWDDATLRAVIDGALPTLAAIGVLLVGVLAAGAARGGTRPLGTVWDIVCFLPRTGHPFGPPSYAERAVPEIAGRVFAWISADAAGPRRVVLTAHSMGAVLSIAALGVLASSPATRESLSHVRLLTYGAQVRAFFGRMMPELLGPEVVGTRPALGPRLLARDPWAADLAAGLETATTPELATGEPDPGPTARLTGTLLAARGVPWANLWRPTDYLGFPAAGALPNGIDRLAEEIDLSGYMVEIGTHPDYPRVPAYTRALAEFTDDAVAHTDAWDARPPGPDAPRG